MKRVTVVGPYFDSDLQFLKRLSAEFAPAELIVGVDPNTVSISEQAGRALRSAKFVETESLREGIGYLHAKAILFECQGGQEVLITGSANPSSPAWLNPPNARNAEAVVLRITSGKNSVAKAGHQGLGQAAADIARRMARDGQAARKARYAVRAFACDRDGHRSGV